MKVEVSECYNSMTLTRIQGQGHGRTKVAEMADFKVSPLPYACNQKTNGPL